MGAWGTGLYDDDTTCDVRDQWLEKLKSGTPAEAATAEMIAEWGGAADERLFWLALADTQRRWGRLESEVRERAEQALAAGGGLELWSDSPPKARAARKRVLERIAAQLREPPLPPRPVRVQSEAIAWKRGQLWAYQMLDGRQAVLRVAAFDPACGLVGAPVMELLDVALDALPPARPLADATVRPARQSHTEGRVDFLAPEHRVSPMFEPKVKQRGELPRARLKKLRAAGEPRPATAETKTFGVAWSAFDQFLANMFDLGAPRLGSIHGWQTPDGVRRYTVLEWMEVVGHGSGLATRGAGRQRSNAGGADRRARAVLGAGARLLAWHSGRGRPPDPSESSPHRVGRRSRLGGCSGPSREPGKAGGRGARLLRIAGAAAEVARRRLWMIV